MSLISILHLWCMYSFTEGRCRLLPLPFRRIIPNRSLSSGSVVLCLVDFCACLLFSLCMFEVVFRKSTVCVCLHLCCRHSGSEKPSVTFMLAHLTWLLCTPLCLPRAWCPSGPIYLCPSFFGMKCGFPLSKWHSSPLVPGLPSAALCVVWLEWTLVSKTRAPPPPPPGIFLDLLPVPLLNCFEV